MLVFPIKIVYSVYNNAFVPNGVSFISAINSVLFLILVGFIQIFQLFKKTKKGNYLVFYLWFDPS